MSQNTNMRETYSSIVDAKCRAEAVLANLFNQRHDGSAAAGAVKIPVRTEATAGAYSIADGLDMNAPTTSYVPMVCDKDYAINELIDGFMAAAVPDGMVAERLDSGAYALNNVIETQLAGLLVTEGTASADSTAITDLNVYDKLIDDITTVKEEKVAPAKIWVAATSATIACLQKCSEFVAAAASIDDLGNGFAGKIAGIPVYEVVNLNGLCDWVVGNSDFCHFVEAWSVPMGVNDLSDGKHIGCSAVQGRKAFGFAISNDDTVIVHGEAESE